MSEMGEGTRKSLKRLSKEVRSHELYDGSPWVSVGVEDLKRVMAFLQKTDGVYFAGDTVKWTGVSTPYEDIDEDTRGMVVSDSGSDSVTAVQWDGDTAQLGVVKMYFNEIEPTKGKE